jgi:hypothetical protein
MARVHRLELMLSDDELQEVDEQRGSVPRAVYVRSLIQRPLEVSDVASRAEALAILTAQARSGKVSASIALERALRGDDTPSGDGSLLDRILHDAG